MERRGNRYERMTGWERVGAQVSADNGDESFGCDMVDYNS
jgi:hypothetical protein